MWTCQVFGQTITVCKWIVLMLVYCSLCFYLSVLIAQWGDNPVRTQGLLTNKILMSMQSNSIRLSSTVVERVNNSSFSTLGLGQLLYALNCLLYFWALLQNFPYYVCPSYHSKTTSPKRTWTSLYFSVKILSLSVWIVVISLGITTIRTDPDGCKEGIFTGKYGVVHVHFGEVVLLCMHHYAPKFLAT